MWQGLREEWVSLSCGQISLQAIDDVVEVGKPSCVFRSLGGESGEARSKHGRLILQHTNLQIVWYHKDSDKVILYNKI